MIKQFFEISKNNSTVRTEIVAGVTSFVAAMYIIIVNPSILSQTGMSYGAVLTATVLLSAFSSIMMGLYAKNPILMAPGMGINAYFTYSMVNTMHIPVATALGAVFWSGIIFLLLSVFNIRTLILKAIPATIRYSVATGIGLFITLIGFYNAGFIVVKPPFIGLGEMNSMTLTFIAGLFITSVLVVKRIKGALIAGIIITTVLAYPIGRWYGDASAVTHGNPVLIQVTDFFSVPDFSYFFKLNLVDSLKFSVFPAVFGILFTDMFDSISTFLGVAEAGNLKDKNGQPRYIRKSLITDSFATIMGGLFGSSSGTAYIESAAGIQAGGRTGLTAVVVGLLFLPFMFLAPLAKIVPAIATSPALIIVGVYMMKPVIKINWDDPEEAIPSFLAMVLIPLTYSITQGIIWGFLSYSLLKVVTGKSKEVKPMLWIIDAFAILLLYVEMT